MSAISFSGLASGIDTGQLIDKLVAAEKTQATGYQKQQSTLSSKQNVVDALTSSMSSLGSFARDLGLPSSLQMRTASSSDSHLSVTVSGTATSSVHNVRVNTTAAAQVATSRTFANAAAGVVSNGSVQITGNGTTATVNYDATDTLASIASKINDSKTGVSASVLFDGSTYRLVVGSQKTGVTNAATFVETGDALGLPSHVTVPAKDANLTVDGVTITRPTNVIDDALPGVTITAASAQAATDPDSAVTISNDTAALTQKLKDFVTKYNSVAGAVIAQSTYNAQATTQSALFGDSTMRQLQTSMAALATSTYGGTALSDLGLSIDKDGLMTLDSTKLTTALTSNPTAISDLFVTNGFGKKVSDLANLYTAAGDGVLTVKSKSMQDQFKLLQDQVDQINSNADSLQTRLEAQFSALEQAMSDLNSQKSYLSAIFG